MRRSYRVGCSVQWDAKLPVNCGSIDQKSSRNPCLSHHERLRNHRSLLKQANLDTLRSKIVVETAIYISFARASGAFKKKEPRTPFIIFGGFLKTLERISLFFVHLRKHFLIELEAVVILKTVATQLKLLLQTAKQES